MEGGSRVVQALVDSSLDEPTALKCSVILPKLKNY